MNNVSNSSTYSKIIKVTYGLSVYLKSTLPLSPTRTGGKPNSILTLVGESACRDITVNFLFISP